MSNKNNNCQYVDNFMNLLGKPIKKVAVCGETLINEIKNIDKDKAMNRGLVVASIFCATNGVINASERMSKDTEDQATEIIAGQPQDDINSVKTIGWGVACAMAVMGLGRKKDENDNSSFSQRFMKNTRNAFNGR